MNSDFVEALVESPTGAALLAVLEAMQRPDVPWWAVWMETSDARAVGRAVEWVSTVSMGEILSHAVTTAEWEIGLNVSGSPGKVASAYRLVDQRRPIAVALAARLEAALHEPVDLDNQQWWTSAPEELQPSARSRECPLLWTTSNLSAEVHEAVVCYWDFGQQTSHWRIAIEGQPRIKEIHRPADWVELVERYPDPSANTGYHICWKFRNPESARRLEGRRLERRLEGMSTGDVANEFTYFPRSPWQRLVLKLHDRQHRDTWLYELVGIRELLAVPGQHAARRGASQIVNVDWNAASEDYDGCHLSWAGFLTTEGYVCDLGNGSFTMLQGIGSEHTLWLADVFGAPTPLDAPQGLPTATSGDHGIDVTTNHRRATQDLLNLEVTLGRRLPPTKV